MFINVFYREIYTFIHNIKYTPLYVIKMTLFATEGCTSHKIYVTYPYPYIICVFISFYHKKLIQPCYVFISFIYKYMHHSCSTHPPFSLTNKNQNSFLMSVLLKLSLCFVSFTINKLTYIFLEVYLNNIKFLLSLLVA